MGTLTVRSTWKQLSSLFSDRKREAKSSEIKKDLKQEPLRVTPELEARIAEAEKNCREGNCATCRNI